MTLVNRKLRLSLIFFSKESTKVSTAMTEKIPMVTPSKDRMVRNRLERRAFHANPKLSAISRKVTIRHLTWFQSARLPILRGYVKILISTAALIKCYTGGV